MVFTLGVLLAWSGWVGPGMLLKPPQCPGQPHREQPSPDVSSAQGGGTLHRGLDVLETGEDYVYERGYPVMIIYSTSVYQPAAVGPALLG